MEDASHREIDSYGQTRGTIHKRFAVASSRAGYPLAGAGGSGSLAAGGGDVSPMNGRQI